MRTRTTISIDKRIREILEEEAKKLGVSFSAVLAEYAERWIALRNRVGLTLSERFTEEEKERLSSYARKVVERPVSKESVLANFSGELKEKLKELSECEINLLLSYFEIL